MPFPQFIRATSGRLIHLTPDQSFIFDCATMTNNDVTVTPSGWVEAVTVIVPGYGLRPILCEIPCDTKPVANSTPSRAQCVADALAKYIASKGAFPPDVLDMREFVAKNLPKRAGEIFVITDLSTPESKSTEEGDAS